MDEQVTAQDGNVVMRLLSVVMVVAIVAMTAFLFVAFRSPAALLFGGMMIIAVLALLLELRRPRRAVLRSLAVVLVAATVAMATYMFIAFKGNPSALLFAGMMLMSMLGLLMGGRRPGSTEDEEVTDR